MAQANTDDKLTGKIPVGFEGKWWHLDSESQRIVCDLCPRECHLKSGDKGFCFVRENRDGKMVLGTYGKSTGFCIDPIEKKPLNHFYPGTSVLSFGTAGCNLGCKFCQNWDISKSREVARLSEHATPEMIALAAKEWNCKSVAFTYNDPVIWAEYAIDTAIECKKHGIQSVAVTAGYISPKAREDFFRVMDAANVDLKAFTEEFYHKITYSHLQPVLDTLVYLKHHTEVWFEITNLIIPDANDNPDELRKMCDWILEAIGPDVPVHFSAFHPDFRMMDRPRTPVETLVKAYDIATTAGLNYVFVGNVHDKARQNTYCPKCKECLVERDWYELGRYNLDMNRCGSCGYEIAGRFQQLPGTWGQKRQPVKLTQISTQAAAASRPAFNPNSVPNVPSPNTLHALPSRTPLMSQAPAINSPTPEILRMDQLDEAKQRLIHRMASRFVAASAQYGSLPRSVIDELGELARTPVMGIFVTLKRGKQLRGCCGLIGQPIPLADALLNASHRTAREDSRMPPISPSELEHLSLDVTVLAAPEPMQGVGETLLDQFEIGKHGLRMWKGEQGGLLLPSVPVEQGWNKRQFMEGLCRKAGLPEDAWKFEGVTVERFEGLPIEGHIAKEDIGDRPRAKPVLTQDEVMRLRGHLAQNILALAQGATPAYYTPDVSDGNVHGLVVSLFDANGRPLAHLLRLSLRPGMALQSSLFELAKTSAQILMQAQPKQQVQVQLALTVLHDPGLHGHTGKTGPAEEVEYHVEGIDTKHRAVVCMMGNQRIAVAFDPSKTAQELVGLASDALSAHGRPVTVYSMEYIATLPALVAHSAPVAQLGGSQRSPAVAGTFYPADDAERQKMIAERLPSGENQPEKKSVLAIMSPHAGLVYSGKIAGDVWSRVAIPKSVLLIGPKHTPDGVDWAVAPHRHWKISATCSFDADIDLSQRIAGGVSGMQMDAVAHYREHGLEVQLPFLEALAPKTKIAAVVMSGGTWVEIEQAAKQLADVLRALDEMPLLVISSDMNHYANDAENRRKDRLALEAMKTGDPKKLLHVCTENSISMCGLLPAVLVMQTLRELGLEFHCEEVSYATSADAGAEPERVVGYAGMLICN